MVEHLKHEKEPESLGNVLQVFECTVTEYAERFT